MSAIYFEDILGNLDIPYGTPQQTSKANVIKHFIHKTFPINKSKQINAYLHQILL